MSDYAWAHETDSLRRNLAALSNLVDELREEVKRLNDSLDDAVERMIEMSEDMVKHGDLQSLKWDMEETMDRKMQDDR